MDLLCQYSLILFEVINYPNTINPPLTASGENFSFSHSLNTRLNTRLHTRPKGKTRMGHNYC